MDMRRFLNIVKTSQEAPAPAQTPRRGILREYLLVEAQDYAAMFAPIVKMMAMLPEIPGARGSFQEEITNSVITSEVIWAKKNLKKNDRIVWYLRLVRLGLAARVEYRAEMLDGRNPDAAEKYALMARAIYDKIQDDLQAKTGSGMVPDLYTLSQSLIHYLSLPIPALQNIVWDRQTPDALTIQFQKLEDEWKARQSELIPHDPQDGQVILEFQDGMAWVLLPRGYCPDEAKAMGHCGNAGAKAGERILSLRRKVKGDDGQLHWRPSLTFILDSKGFLGEMKGRANNKPEPKYHSHIFALLMNRDLIKGIKGGGYKPEANFAITDLTPEEQERLFEDRPELANASWYLKKKGFDETFKETVEKEFDAHDLISYDLQKDCWDGQQLRVKKFKDWREIYEDYGDKEAQHYAEPDVAFNLHFDIGKDDIENFIDHYLPDSTWKKIVEYLKAQYGNEDDDDDSIDGRFDPDSVSDMLYLMEEQGDELRDTLRDAVSDGQTAGTEKEIDDALEKGLTETKLDYGHFVFEGYGTQFTYDVPVYLQLELKELAKLLDNPGDFENIANYGWIEKKSIKISVPQYGFQEFDGDAALERFYENAPDEFDTRRKFPDASRMSNQQIRAEIAELAPQAYAKYYQSEKKIKEVIDQSYDLNGHQLRNLLLDVRRKVSYL